MLIRCRRIPGRARRENRLAAHAHLKTEEGYQEGEQGAMRGFLTVVVIMAVLVLGALEVIAPRSLADADRRPNTSASTPYYWR